MTTEIVMMDRDDFLAQQRAEQGKAENDSEIARLIQEIKTARASLRHSEASLAAIEAALSGTDQTKS